MTTNFENIYYSDISAMRKALEKISIELEKANKIEADRIIGISGGETNKL